MVIADNIGTAEVFAPDLQGHLKPKLNEKDQNKCAIVQHCQKARFFKTAINLRTDITLNT